MKQQLNKPLALSMAVACAVFTANTMAAGFQINEHSASSLGRALAGEAAIAENASALAHNPALASFFDGAHFSGGLSFIAPDVNARGNIASNITPTPTSFNADASDVAPDAVVPNAYYLRPINDSVAFGLSLNSHFGLSTDYGDDYVGSDLANLAEILTLNISPSLSYKFNDQLSVGLGVSFVYGEGHLLTTLAPFQQQVFEGGRQLFNAAPGLPDSRQIPAFTGNHAAELEGDDWGFGFNFGLAYKPIDSVTIGLSYRSEVDLALSGEVNTDLEERAALNPAFGTVGVTALDNDGVLDLALPAISQFAVAWDVTSELKLSGSVHHIGWSSVPTITVNLPSPNGGTFPRELEELLWDDTYRYGIAAAYKVTNDLTLRTGYALDETPTSDAHRTLAIPDGDRKWISVGATYALSETMSIDAGYTFINGDPSNVDQTSPLGSNFRGTVEGDAQVFALSLNYAL